MPQVNNHLKRKLTILVFCFLVGSVRWFWGIQAQHLNPDEPMWIAMTEFYDYRKQENWQKFSTHQPDARLGYGSQSNIAVDQPQTGKYILGFLLTLTHQNPWKIQDISWIYSDFSTSKIPSDQSPQTLKNYLGPELTTAIEFVRVVSSVVGWLSIIVFSWVVYYFTQSFFSTGITFLLVTFNPIFLNYLRKAMMDSFSAFVLFMSGIIICFAVKKLFSRSQLTYFLFCLGGILSAIAASVKINGLFLFGFPFWLCFIHVFLDKNISFAKCSKTALALTIFSVSFLGIFCYLEPVTWTSPVKGIQALVNTRLSQQARFFSAFGQVHFFLMPAYALYIFISRLHIFISIPMFILFNLGLTQHIIATWNKHKKSMYILSVIGYVLLVNFYYAQTGFDRYLIPTLFCFFFIQSLGLKIAHTKLKTYAVT